MPDMTPSTIGDAYPGLGGAPSRAVQVALVLVAAILLTWPAWINGFPLIFYDSAGYIQQGRTAMSGVLALLTPQAEGAAPGAGGAAPHAFAAVAASAEFIRSLGYSVFAYLVASIGLGAFGVILAQSLLLAGVLALLLRPELERQPRAALVASIVLIAFTPLAWFASYLMPDVLAAVPILAAMILVRAEGRPLGTLPALFLLGVTTFAVLSHYGHLPLAAATGLAALTILLFQKRLTAAALVVALAPPILASAINLVGSSVAFQEASVAPKRLPLLLARSIADGPALWYLQDACPERSYAICEVFDGEIPSNLQALLWAEGGILRGATPEQSRRVREEEFVVLQRAFMSYPLEQTGSLAQNAAEQLFLVGTGDFQWGRFVRNPATGELYRGDEGRRGLDFVALVHIASSLAALGVIAAYGWRDGLRVSRGEREMLAVLLIGLLANAAIFGGLSAPVDRYQSRIVWIVAVFAALLWLARRPGAGAHAPRRSPS